MIAIHTPYGTVDMSADLYRDYKSKISTTESDNLESFDSRLRSVMGFNFEKIALYLLSKGFLSPQNPRMLHAHGRNINSKYTYVEKPEGKRIYTPVNKWLDKYDGKHDTLIVFSCNPNRIKLKSRNSLLVYPIGDIDQSQFSNLSRLDSILRVVPPKRSLDPNSKLEIFSGDIK